MHANLPVANVDLIKFDLLVMNRRTKQCLLHILTGQVIQKYTGHAVRRHAIKSCFGGVGNYLVVSGSEDSEIYIWNRETDVLLGALSGHGGGGVNAVAWNPEDDYVFASCSDDHSVRIWQLPLPGNSIGNLIESA